MRTQALYIRLSVCGVLTCLPAAFSRAQEVDFIRGDANGDGVVSSADYYRILGFLSGRFEPPDCMRSADVDDNGLVEQEADLAYLSLYLSGSGPPPPPPFPNPGPDPTPTGEIDCQAYGGGSPRVDPSAKLQILDAFVPGGVGVDRTVTLRIAMSNSSPALGFVGAVRIAGARIQGIRMGFHDGDLTGTASRPVSVAQGEDGAVVYFGLFSDALFSADGTTWIPPGSDVPVLEIIACIESRTAAGDYLLTLEKVEIIDAESAQPIYPAVQGGLLTVAADVDFRAPCGPEPPGPQATMALGGGSAAPGGSVAVPLVILSDEPVEGYSFSVDFDEDVLSAEEIEVVWQRPDGLPYDFQFYELNNNRTTPGSHGVDEGFIVGAAVFDFEGLELAKMPAATDNLALRLHLRVIPGTTSSGTAVTFLDGGRARDRAGSFHNIVTAQGTGIDVELVDARIVIQQNLVTFLRGDANTDGLLDISDPQATLDFLFLGRDLPTCLDAVDANDDGQLNISDPIAALGYLFLGSPGLPAPFGGCGADPTDDGLDCTASAACP